MSPPRTIPIALGERSYDVLIGPGLLACAGDLIAPLAKSGRVFIVTDDNVGLLHLQKLEAALSKPGAITQVTSIVEPPGEQQKSFKGLESLCHSLLTQGVERSDLIIAFGGGVIGDLTGLAAGLIKRGVDFVQIPTTLLAQVDSSVGGKTAIDTTEGKNLIGLFNQPRLVIADLEVLQTLPHRELRAGYAEIVKIGLIEDAAFFHWCEANAATLLSLDEPSLERSGDDGAANADTMAPEADRDNARAYAVSTAVAAKAAIVAADEREQGRRALLNLGHTFAHALEAHGDYGATLLHGEAVAAGIALAFDFAAQHDICPQADAARVSAHLQSVGFVTDIGKLAGAPFDPARLFALMAADKKNEGGALTLILPRGIGQAFVHKHANAHVVAAFLSQKTQS